MAPPRLITEERWSELCTDILPNSGDIQHACRIAAQRWGLPSLHRSTIEGACRARGTVATQYLGRSSTAVHPVQVVQNGSLRAELEQLRSEVTHIAPQPVASTGQSLVLLLGDLHIGCEGTAATLQRLHEIPGMVAQHITELTDEIVVCLVGDLVDGEGIYPGQGVGLRSAASGQVKQCVEALWQCIAALSELVPAVRIHAIRGNHGRTDASPESNWDHMACQQVELLCDMTGIATCQYHGEMGVVDVRGHRGMLIHKAPVQCETAAAARRFADWSSIYGADWIAYGHWHHWGVSSRNKLVVLRNGALCGSNDYARRLGFDARPAQLLFGCTAEQAGAWVRALEWQ